MLCSAASASASTCWRIASTGTYVRVPVTFFHSNGSRRLEVSCTSLLRRTSRRIEASDTRLEFEMALHYFDSFLFTLTSLNATCSVGRATMSARVRQRGGNHEKLSDHEIFNL